MRYVVVVEKGENSYGAHVPDFPGCAAAAETREEVIRLIKEALEFHIEGMKENGEIVPGYTERGSKMLVAIEVEENQFIKRGDINISWSYSGPEHVWIYNPRGYKIIIEENL